MSEPVTTSIFQRYYAPDAFIDRFAANPAGAIDVVIPIIHTNELWESNLLSIYREVPVNRLLLGDGGCVDNSLDIAARFPRVVVCDHREYKSLGYSIRKLIEEVETDWFAYLHSDVYLPPDWFEKMAAHQEEYDWFGCPMRITALIEYPNVDKMFDEVRPYAGSQMGRKQAFVEGLKRIDDDYVYRQEDFVFADVVNRSGYREGRIEDTFHYHQVMHKESPWARKLKRVAVEVEWSREEQIRASMMQVRGIVKYLRPSLNLAREVEKHLAVLVDLRSVDFVELMEWVKAQSPEWKTHIRPIRIKVSLLLKRMWRLPIRRTVTRAILGVR